MSIFIPIIPPGYIFVTNHGNITNELQANSETAKFIGVPIEDVISLANMIPSAKFSSYCLEKHKSIVDRKIASIKHLLAELSKLDDDDFE
jgi:hypothetical protein